MRALGWQESALYVIAAALLGWLAGGLANWAADRLPHGRAGIDPPPANTSTCRAGTWYLVPSHTLTLPWYFFRAGVCPHCGTRRPLRAPVLELATVAAFLAGWLRLRESPVAMAAFFLYAWFLLTVAAIDLEHRLVLNVMLAPMAVVALGLSLLPGKPDPLNALVGGAAGLALFLVIAALGRGAMGAGDVKLAGVIGLMMGYPAVFQALFTGVLFGGAAALALLLSRRAKRKGTMAYAPYLALGAFVTLWRIL